MIARLEQALAAAATKARDAPLLAAEAKTLRCGPPARPPREPSPHLPQAADGAGLPAAAPAIAGRRPRTAPPPARRAAHGREENAFLLRLRHKEEIEALQQQVADLQAQLAAREQERGAREGALLERAQQRDAERAERERALQAAGGQLAAAARRAHEAAAARERALREQLAAREAELRAGYSGAERDLRARLAAQEGALQDRLGGAERERLEALMRGDRAAAAAATAHNELLATTKRYAREVAQLKARLADKDAQLVAAGLPLGAAALLEAAGGGGGAGGGRLQPLQQQPAAWEGGRRGGSAGPRMEGTRAAPLTPLALPRVSTSADGGGGGGGGGAGLLPLGGELRQGGGRRASMTAADAVRRRSLTSVPEDAAPGALPQRDSRGWSPGSLI